MLFQATLQLLVAYLSIRLHNANDELLQPVNFQCGSGAACSLSREALMRSRRLRGSLLKWLSIVHGDATQRLDLDAPHGILPHRIIS